MTDATTTRRGSSLEYETANVTGDGDDAMGSENEKQRLTEEQKKLNHIESEKKRREQIRKGFDEITTLVPGTEGMARTEGMVLEKTIGFLREQIAERKRLVEMLEARGVAVHAKDKEPFQHAEQAEADRRARGGTASSNDNNNNNNNNNNNSSNFTA